MKEMIKNHCSRVIFLFIFMGLYAFELGRQKELCFAELKNMLGEKSLVEKNLDTAIFELEGVEGMMDQLGGTIKIIEILGETSKQNIENDIEKILNDIFKGHEKKKVTFAISKLSFASQHEINIKNLLIFSKKILKNLDLTGRFVNKGPSSPPSSTIFKAGILKKGIDLCIIKGQKKWLLGRTVAIQNINDYSKRDYDKPARDAKIGMLPPKLAQIMINLLGVNVEKIYDPFCGTGTVLTEALLMDLSTMGSDLNREMVEATQKNCEWLAHEFKTDSAGRIFHADARALNMEVKKGEFDAIVTEGYLGAPLTKVPSQEEQEIRFRELANLHASWLAAAGQLMEKGQKIVMCVAAIQDGKKLIHLPRFEEIATIAGFRILETFTYHRSDQIVVRDIKILEKI